MSIYAHIKRCLELSDREIVSAIADRRLTRALVDQLSKVSKPSDGAPKLLLLFAKMASQGIEWIDGALRIEMAASDAGVTTVEVLCEMGLGMHERVVPSFKMNVPLEEFVRAVERVPHMIEPLTIVTSSDKRLVLTSSTEEEEDEDDSAASEVVPIADDSLYHRTPSRDKMPAVVVPMPAAPIVAVAPAAAAPKARAVRRSSRPEMPAVVPKIISARSGKTLRPAPPAPPAPDAPPPSQRVVPVVPKAPPLPSAQAKPAQPAQPEIKRSAIARVPLTKIQVPRSAVAAHGAHDKNAAARATPSATKRASKPPGKRMSVKPPAVPAKKASKPPPRTSARPPARTSPPPKSKRGSISEPPDEESIDLGWDEDS